MQPLVDILRALSGAGVSFVVVGGVAVVLQGHPRMTADLDLVVDLSVDNVRKTVDVLEHLGLVPRLPVAADQFADPEVRRRWVEERNLTVFSMYDPDDPMRVVDIFADPPINFSVLHSDAAVMDVGGTQVSVASRAHLIEMKQLAGRAQDLADIEALQALDSDE